MFNLYRIIPPFQKSQLESIVRKVEDKRRQGVGEMRGWGEKRKEEWDGGSGGDELLHYELDHYSHL